ncbi:MAG: hypothetical protein ACRDZ3_20370 [Acidimicrobiia bacterium]
MDALLAVVLIGFGMFAVAVMHLRLTARPPDVVRLPLADDVDAEFFRMIHRERLWNAWPPPGPSC